MAKVIGLSGPQGGGKTSILNGLRDVGFYVDDFKVSRHVQHELGWDSLSNVMQDPETMMKFQVKVRDTKFVRDLENSKRSDVDIILTERTFADIVTYTQLWSWELVENGKWSHSDALDFLLDFVDLCALNQEVYSANVILPKMKHVVFEYDPHRANETHLSFVDSQLRSFFNSINPKNIPTHTITSLSINDRVNEVSTWIKSL